MGGFDRAARLKQLPRLWCNPACFAEQTIQLEAAQNHYLKRVLRLRAGAEILVLNGEGQIWRALWHEATAQLVELLTLTPTEPPFPVWLGVGVLKGDTMDWLIQKATELGVTTIQPLTTAYTQLTPSPQKQLRWQQISREACEQCERLYLPQILPVMPLVQVQCPSALQYIAVARQLAKPTPLLLNHLQTQVPQPIGIWIGPEGGWQEQEVHVHAAMPVSLGTRILRAETAVCTALSLITAWMEA